MPIYGSTGNDKPGTLVAWPASSAPSGYLKCNGAAVSRSLYAALFNVIGTTYGVGDGSSTFNLPDLRGEFLRGLDDGRGVDTSRVLGASQSDAIRNITGAIGNVSTFGTGVSTGSGALVESGQSGASYSYGAGGNRLGSISLNASLAVPTATENRPRNQAALYVIKY